ncbi:MAG: hypothetical protein U0T84_04905 [Chitinophagales bacterium]
MQQKLADTPQRAVLERNFNRLQALFEEAGFLVQNPLHEKYSSSRTDCEASIVGQPGERMKITRVLKPVIYQKLTEGTQLVQKAVVIVENE